MQNIFNAIGKVLIGAVVVVGSWFGVHSGIAPQQKLGANAQVPMTCAFFQTVLSTSISATDATATIASNQATPSGTCSNGFYGFIIDANNPSRREAIEGYLTGTTITNITRGISPVNPNVTSTAFAFPHNVGASVIVSDYSFLGHAYNILTGSDTFPNIISYAANNVFTSSTQIVDKNYVDTVATSGAPDAGIGSKGLIAIGTPTSSATSTDGSSVLYNVLGVGSFSSSSIGSQSGVLTNVSGTLDPSFVSSTATYSFNNLISASTTLNGTTTASGTIVLNGQALSVNKFGGTGADGALSLSSTTTSTINVGSASVFIKNYTSISITASSSLTFSNPATNGTIVILKSQGNCTLTSSNASGTIVLNGLGATSGNYGNSLSGGGPTSGYLLGGSFSQPGPSTEGFTTGFGGQGHHVAPSSTFISAAFAGAGGGTGSFNAGAGGNGGGGLIIECGGSLNFTGTINANGNVGAAGTGSSGFNGSYCSAPGGGGNADGAGPSCSNTGTGTPTTTQGGGGGGGGSTIMLYNGTLVANTGTINVGGGAGGTGTHDNGQAGGAGYSFVGQNTEY